MSEFYEVMKMVDVVIIFDLIIASAFYGIITVLFDGITYIGEQIKKRREKKKSKEQQE